MKDLIFHFYTNGHKLLTNFSLMKIRVALMEIRVGKKSIRLELVFHLFQFSVGLGNLILQVFLIVRHFGSDLWIA